MNTHHWNLDWGYTFVYENNKIIGVLASCPYCGHRWVYKGGDKHIATCHGKGTYTHDDGSTSIHDCHHKVRLHPYLLNLKYKDPDDFKRRNYGKTHPSKLKYPNKNYMTITELREENSNRRKS